MRQLSNLAFSFHVPGLIWKTAIDQNTGKLAMEIRDQEELKTSFSVLDLINPGKEKDFTIEHVDWWSSLQLFDQGYLFIEKYLDPQNPVDKALIVANSIDGKVFRHLPGHQMIDVKDGKLNYQKIEDPTSHFTEELPGVVSGGGTYHFAKPVVFEEGSLSFGLVAEYLAGHQIVSLVDYLEYQDCIIISYYEKSEKELARKLVVIREEREIYHEVLDHRMEGIAPEAFFVFNNYLIFIVERKQINGIEL